MNNDFLSKLQAYAAQSYLDRENLHVSDLISINDGWESDVYSFCLSWNSSHGRISEDCILRLYPGVDAYAKSAAEFKAIQTLYALNYPVPRVDRLERDASPFGAPSGRPFLIMEKIKGASMWNPLFHSAPPEQEKFLHLFIDLFVRLHSLDWPAEPGTPNFPNQEKSAVVQQLDRWQATVTRIPIGGFQANWEWLIEHSRDIIPRPAVPTHWDYHPNNLLLKADGSAVVIDWTGFELTDYRFDLAWTMLLAGSSESPEWRGRILRAYERQSGQAAQDMPFFHAACALRRLISVVVSINYGADQLGMRPGAEAAMRSQAPALRRVYEILLATTSLPVPEVEQFLNQCRA